MLVGFLNRLFLDWIFSIILLSLYARLYTIFGNVYFYSCNNKHNICFLTGFNVLLFSLHYLLSKKTFVHVFLRRALPWLMALFLSIFHGIVCHKFFLWVYNYVSKLFVQNTLWFYAYKFTYIIKNINSV